MTKDRFKELCNLVISEEFLEFLNTITTQKGAICVYGKQLKDNYEIRSLWSDVHIDAIGIKHGDYKFQNEL